LPAVVLGILLVALGIDFHTYEAAAQVGLQQGWAHIYDQPLVAAEQTRLVPDLWTQPFLSPPTVAWLAASLAPLPYIWAYIIWAAVTFAAYALALAWSVPSRGLARWIAIVAATAAWWVVHAVHLGQVAPLVAAGMAVAWRLLREERNVAAGVVLALVALKPNTAFLVPLALLAAGRFRTFATWAVAGATLALLALATMGFGGVSAYVSQLTGHLPAGADQLTIEGALGVSGPAALALRVLIVGAALVAAFRLRRSPGLVIAVGILGSLVAAPYLHGSDLCLLSVAALIVWEERPAAVWRAPIAIGWLVASPFFYNPGREHDLNVWLLLELVMLVAMVVMASQVDRKPVTPAAPAFG
jgi:alpha-1,2-mannosyltransferase